MWIHAKGYSTVVFYTILSAFPSINWPRKVSNIRGHTNHANIKCNQVSIHSMPPLRCGFFLASCLFGNHVLGNHVHHWTGHATHQPWKITMNWNMVNWSKSYKAIRLGKVQLLPPKCTTDLICSSGVCTTGQLIIQWCPVKFNLH